MKTILITGATGFLGSRLVEDFLKEDQYQILAFGRTMKTDSFPSHSRLKVYPLESLFREEWGSIDTVVNCAFARSNDPELLAAAINFTQKAIGRFKDIGVSSVINISSQGVYKRLTAGELSGEDSPIAPVDMYSMAKYSCERLFSVSSIPYVTNVRMSSLYMPQRFLYSFIKKAIEGKVFTVTSPNQYMSLLDVSDASSGISSIVRLAPEKRSDVYNLGLGVQYSLLEYAECVKSVGNALGYNVEYDVVDGGTGACAGVDCTRLTVDTGWKPEYYLKELVEKSFMEFSAGQERR